MLTTGNSAWPFLIYLVRLPIRVAIYAAIFRAIGYTKPIFIAAMLSFIANIIVSIVLLVAGRHGFLSYIGPSIGTSFGTVVSVSYLLMILCKKLEVRFAQVMRWKELGRIFGLSFFCGVLLWLTPIPFSNLLFKFVIRFILYVMYFFGALVLTKSLNADEWELLRATLAMIRKIAAEKGH